MRPPLAPHKCAFQTAGSSSFCICTSRVPYLVICQDRIRGHALLLSLSPSPFAPSACNFCYISSVTQGFVFLNITFTYMLPAFTFPLTYHVLPKISPASGWDNIGTIRTAVYPALLFKIIIQFVAPRTISKPHAINPDLKKKIAIWPELL